MKVIFHQRTWMIVVLIFSWWGSTSQAASTPVWWTQGVLDNVSTNPADNWAMANVGQLKNFATKAKAHLDGVLGLTAGDWNSAYGGVGQNPFPFATQPNPDNFAPITVGQLKFVVSGFYTILNTKAPLYDLRARLQSFGVPASSISGNRPYFPWSASTQPGENFSSATIGQLKVVFSFDLTGFVPISPNLDANHNGIPDVWEYAGFGQLVGDPLTDTYGDGLTIIVKYLGGINPSAPTQIVPSSTQINLKILTP